MVQAGLEALFIKRERAQAVTLWADGREFAPTLSVYGGPYDTADTLALWPVDSASAAQLALPLPLPLHTTTLRDMEAFFRDEPAGWEAWFRANPGDAGIVEIVTPRIRGDSAQLLIGRACGEQCRSAWRLSLVRDGAGWRVHRLDVLRVPR